LFFFFCFFSESRTSTNRRHVPSMPARANQVDVDVDVIFNPSSQILRL
jgi:hypothetical protein